MVICYYGLRLSRNDLNTFIESSSISTKINLEDYPTGYEWDYRLAGKLNDIITGELKFPNVRCIYNNNYFVIGIDVIYHGMKNLLYIRYELDDFLATIGANRYAQNIVWIEDTRRMFQDVFNFDRS